MKTKSLFFIISLAVLLFFAPAVGATDNSALIAQITAQIAQLQAELQAMLSSQGWCHTFNTNLGFANSGSSEVGDLHTALQAQGFLYSPDSTNTYAQATANAVMQFQAKYDIRQTGFVGIATRAMLNSLYRCGATAVTNPVTNPTAISTAASICTSFTYTDWTTCSSFGTQTRTVLTSYPSGCIGGNPTTSQICTYNNANTVSSCYYFNYSDWSACSSSGTQTRTVTSAYPSGCTGGTQTLSQSCTYIPPCAESNWTFTLSPTTCGSSGSQTKFWTKVGTCTGGIEHPSYETITCNYQAPTCTSFSYSDWSTCNSSGVHTRTVYSSSPYGCAGGNPVTSETCTYIPTCTDANWTSTLTPPTCPTSGYQTRTWTKVGECTYGVYHYATESNYCNYQTPTCTGWTYSDWTPCNSSGTQTRTTSSPTPTGCTGGTPDALSRNCTYVPQACTEANWTSSLSPTVCPNSGQQTKNWTKVGDCTGGVSHSTEIVNCMFQAPTCTSFNYTGYTNCVLPGIRTRSVTSSSPDNCVGGNPITSESCCASQWTCTNWFPATCLVNGTQTRTCTDNNHCATPTDVQATTQQCYGAPTVTLYLGSYFTYPSSYWVTGPFVNMKTCIANTTQHIPNCLAGNTYYLEYVTNNADYCLATGNWAGQKTPQSSLPNGAYSEQITPLNQTQTFTLTCTNSASGVSASSTITVSD